MVNERPLCPSNDQAQQIALTPAHFLHASFRTFSLDPAGFDKPDDDRSAAARRLIHFWNQDAEYLRKLWLEWKHSYLVHLRDKIRPSFPNAHLTTQYSPKIGEIVHVLDFQKSPGVYKLAKIINLEKSADGLVRRAGIEFPDGYQTNRVIKFLAPLELQCMTTVMKSLPKPGFTQKEKSPPSN